MASDGNRPPDFNLEFYKAHRAHEAVLNNAAAAYEQSLLRLILIMNAASIGGFATLLQSETKGTPTISFSYHPAIYAFYVWGIGILAAFAATCIGYLSQRWFTQAYRYRRQAIELEETASADWPERLGIPAAKGDKAVIVQNLRTDATTYRNLAGVGSAWAQDIGLVAFAAAVVGFALAILSVRSNVPL